MAAPNFFLGNNWFTFWDSEQSNYPHTRIDGTPLKQYDTLLDIRTGSIRQYAAYSPPGFQGWQPSGVLGDSNGDPINYGSEVEFAIIDQEGTATAYPTLSFGCLNGTLTTPVKKFTVVMNNNILYFKQGDITGTNVMTFDASGNVKIWNNLEVVGNIVLNDMTTGIITLKDRIQHYNNTTNFISMGTDIINLNASATSIALNDTAISDKVTITGATKFNNAINAVPDVYLANHVHHLNNTTTRMGFPANDQIGLRTGGVDRILIGNSNTSINNNVTVQSNTAGTAVVSARCISTENVFEGKNSSGTQTSSISSNGNITGSGLSINAPVQWNGMFYTGGVAPAYIQIANGSTGAGSANGMLVGLNSSGNGVINVQGAFGLTTTVAGVDRYNISTAGLHTLTGTLNVNNVFNVNNNQMSIAANSATTTFYNQTIGTISPSTPVLFSVPTGRANGATYNLTIDASSYLGGTGYYCTTVGRGYIFSGALYGASVTNLSQFGLAVAVSYNSDTSLAITISDTSGVASVKSGTVSVRLTVSN